MARRIPRWSPRFPAPGIHNLLSYPHSLGVGGIVTMTGFTPVIRLYGKGEGFYRCNFTEISNQLTLSLKKIRLFWVRQVHRALAVGRDLKPERYLAAGLEAGKDSQVAQR